MSAEQHCMASPSPQRDCGGRRQKLATIHGMPSPAPTPTNLFESWTSETSSTGGVSDRYAQSLEMKQDLKCHFLDLDGKMELMRKQLCDCLEGIRELQLRPAYDAHSVSSQWHSERESLVSADVAAEGRRASMFSDRLSGQDNLRDVGRVPSGVSYHSSPKRLMPAAAWDAEPNCGVTFTATSSYEPPSGATTSQMLRLPSMLSSNTVSMRSTSLAVTSHRRNVYAKILWEVLEEAGSSRAARNWGRFWLCFVTASVLSTLLQALSAPGFAGSLALALEVFFELAFAAELLVRYSVCPTLCYFMRNTSNILDIVSVLPLALRAATGLSIVSAEDNTDLLTWLLLNVVPVLRLLKCLRFTNTEWELFKKVLESVWGALGFLLFIGGIILLVFSALIYLVEPRDNIESFPRAMWLTLVTMTTVGYGDVFPSTAEGRAIIATLMLFSALYLSMPIGLVGSAFTQVWQDRDRIILVDKMQRRLKQWGYDAQDTPMLFKRYDSDNDGEINLGDFRRMLQDFGIFLSEERILELFGTFDNDNSGSVDDGEFIHVLFPQTWHDMKEEERQREEEEERKRKLAREKEKERKERSRSQLLKSQQEFHKAQQALQKAQEEEQQKPPASPSSLTVWGRQVTGRISGSWRGKSREALGDITEEPQRSRKVSPCNHTCPAILLTTGSAPEDGPTFLELPSQESSSEGSV